MSVIWPSFPMVASLDRPLRFHLFEVWLEYLFPWLCTQLPLIFSFKFFVGITWSHGVYLITVRILIEHLYHASSRREALSHLGRLWTSLRTPDMWWFFDQGAAFFWSVLQRISPPFWAALYLFLVLSLPRVRFCASTSLTSLSMTDLVLYFFL